MLCGERETIGILGAGYVGLVNAAGFAEFGRTVVVYDVDPARIEMLRDGRLPLHEPGLLELLARGTSSGRLRFSSEPSDAIAGAGIVIVAVGTPPDEDGRPDLRDLREAARAIAQHLDGPTVVVNKSTAPLETGGLLEEIIRDARGAMRDVVVVSNPEFLRQGNAVADFLHPDRVVLGCDDPHAEAVLRELYAPLGASVVVTDFRTAQMIKYAANAFLATKISFANELAAICERVGVDVAAVVAAVGADKRIGTAFLDAGLGFGGSCLPKDLDALRLVAADAALQPMLLDAVRAVNARQVERVVARIGSLLGGLVSRRVGVLGLAFKAHTGDVRESAAIALVEQLLSAGAIVCVHDPLAMENARTRLGDRVAYAPLDDHLAVGQGADALVLATDWDAYRDVDLSRLGTMMRERLVVDTRNLYDPAHVTRAGFRYAGMGRPTSGSGNR